MEDMRVNPDMTLSAAVALLIQNQAAFLVQMRESYERFDRIEAELGQIKTILARHDRTLAELTETLAGLPETLAGLPEAIRQRIGFKPPL